MNLDFIHVELERPVAEIMKWNGDNLKELVAFCGSSIRIGEKRTVLIKLDDDLYHTLKVGDFVFKNNYGCYIPLTRRVLRAKRSWIVKNVIK